MRPNMQMNNGFRPHMQNQVQTPFMRPPQRFTGQYQMFRPPMNRSYYTVGQNDPSSMYDAAQYTYDSINGQSDQTDTICVVSTTLNPVIDIYVAGIMDVIVVDSGCKKNVCSIKMVDRIKPYAVNEFKMKPTSCMFRFGGNESKPALGEVDIVLVYLGYHILTRDGNYTNTNKWYKMGKLPSQATMARVARRSATGSGRGF